jgi:RNA polymerase sigma factor (sigma-70 family)
MSDAPDLSALQRGDADAWDAAFRWLWPVVFAVAQTRLGPFLPADVEDVAIESLEELVEAAQAVKRAEELKPLAASIAHNRAVSRLREHFAQKRGGGQTESLEARQEQEGAPELAGGDSPLADVGRSELAALLTELQAELKPEQRALLADFFVHGLSYEQLAAKHGLAMGSVGVYLKRGLEALRRVSERHPEKLKELEAFLR